MMIPTRTPSASTTGRHPNFPSRMARAAWRIDASGAMVRTARDITCSTGTLHTSDAPQTVDRVIDVFPPHQQEQVRIMLANSLQGVCCQQLLPTVHGGRVVATEVLMATPAVRNLIREGKTHQIYSMLQTGSQHGMISMDASLVNLVRKGVVTKHLALERAGSPAELKRLLEGGSSAPPAADRKAA